MKIVLNREELYNQIWEQSLHKVATKYKISDTNLKKICEEIDIPLPDKKYWGKFYFGNEKPKKQILPNSDIKEYTYEIKKIEKNNKNENLERILKQTNYNDKEIMSILNRETKKLSHPIIKILKQNHQKKIRDMKENFYYSDKTEVSEEIQNRIYLIMSVIATLIEKNGFIIKKIDHNYENRFIMIKEDIKVYFRIREKNKRIFVTDDSFLSSNGKKMELIPSGIIEIAINNTDNYDSYFSKIWQDTKTKKLEVRLNEIIAGIINYIEEIKKRNIEAELNKKKYEEQRRIIEEKKYAKKIEQDKFNELEKDAEQHLKATVIRKYINDYEKKENLTEEEINYIKWAKDKADWFDPLINKKDEILDEKIYNSFIL